MWILTPRRHNVAEYESYTRNAILQLRRVREGSQIEQDHMRNRQMVVHWLMETQRIEKRTRDGRPTMSWLTGMLFVMVWGHFSGGARIKSEGDYDAARTLFESTVFILTPHSAMKLFTACRKSMCHRTLDL
ncbi:MAG: hypothetical protein Ct9H300mP25_10800 [Acidobacteriota bacterium]|nr:MAG: hypothetical protein Ct9H300mP25_10800 [Acidobacteriota bacterium]